MVEVTCKNNCLLILCYTENCPLQPPETAVTVGTECTETAALGDTQVSLAASKSSKGEIRHKDRCAILPASFQSFQIKLRSGGRRAR